MTENSHFQREKNCAVINICSAKGSAAHISDEGGGVFAGHWQGCQNEVWMHHWAEVDACSRCRCGCTSSGSAPKFVPRDWPALVVHQALCVLKWERGVKVINAFRPSSESFLEGRANLKTPLPLSYLYWSVVISPYICTCQFIWFSSLWVWMMLHHSLPIFFFTKTHAEVPKTIFLANINGPNFQILTFKMF